MNTYTEISTADDLPEKPDRVELFIRNLFTEPSVMQAALKAGYPESSASSWIYTRLRKPKFQEKIREYARTHELINSVPTILRLEERALKYLADKPAELPKFASILKQKKQIAGLLQQDITVQSPTINIEQVANMMLNVAQSCDKASNDNEASKQHIEIIDIDTQG
jgi:hypothetical protein